MIDVKILSPKASVEKEDSSLSLSDFEKLLESYTKGSEAWVHYSENEWVLATLSDVIVDYEADKISIYFERKFLENEDLTSLSSKEKKLGSQGVWEAQVHQDNQSITLIFKSFISQVCKKRVELPYLRNPLILDGINDLTNLSHLNEPSVLHDLKCRFDKKKIYTYSGVILVSLNPFFPLDIYGEKTMLKYVNQNRNKNEPHLYAVAEDAFNGMSTNLVSQSIIVYGESGAGKTTSAKHLMRYFAHARRNDSNEEMSTVEKQILATNPVFEAFGNAKTTRNDNSSRFGKYIEILFGHDKKSIVGAKTRTFLLERSRICNLPDTERNYHIFYQLLAGSDHKIRSQCLLSDYDWNCFSYLNKGGCGQISGVDDAKDFYSTTEALKLVGIDDEKQEQIWKVLSALLHIGNISVKSDKNGNSLDSFDVCPSFQAASKILGLDQKLLKKCFLSKTIVTNRDVIDTSLKKSQTIVLKDSIAKFLYSRLFDWILGPLNDSLVTKNENEELFVGILDIYGFEYFESNSFEQLCINYANEKLQQHFNNHVFYLEQEEYIKENLSNWEFIGFHDNRPCIELIEGRLGVLTILDEESRLEAATDLTFVHKLYSNLISGSHHKSHNKRKSHDPNSPFSFFEKPRFSNSSFTILHYAHPVTYEGDGFLEKNKDSISDELMNLLRESSFPFVQELVDCNEVSIDSPSHPPNSTVENIPGRSRKQSPTLGAVFRRSLGKLMKKISLTELHYIRCIKSNTDKEPWKFEPSLIVSQLRSCGVLETIKISKAGYPSRINIHEFNDRYRYLLPYKTRAQLIKASKDMDNTTQTPCENKKVLKTSFQSESGSKNLSPISSPKLFGLSSAEINVISDSFNNSSLDLDIVKDGDRDLSKLILQVCIKDSNQYQVGLTKVFFRAGQWANLENMRAKFFNYSAEVIQKNYKRYIYRKRYIKLRDSVITIQRWWRLIYIELKISRFRMKHASIKIFMFWKSQRDRKLEKIRIDELNSKKVELNHNKDNINCPDSLPIRSSSLNLGMFLPYTSWMIPRSVSRPSIWVDRSRYSLLFRNRSIVSSEAKQHMINEINKNVINANANQPSGQIRTFSVENQNYRTRLESDQTDTETLVFPMVSRNSCPGGIEADSENFEDVVMDQSISAKNRAYTLPLNSDGLYDLMNSINGFGGARNDASISSESSLAQGELISKFEEFSVTKISNVSQKKISILNLQNESSSLSEYVINSSNISSAKIINNRVELGNGLYESLNNQFPDLNNSNENQKYMQYNLNYNLQKNGYTRVPLTENRVTNGYIPQGAMGRRKYSASHTISSNDIKKSCDSLSEKNFQDRNMNYKGSGDNFGDSNHYRNRKPSSVFMNQTKGRTSIKSVESINAKILKRIQGRSVENITPSLIRPKTPVPDSQNKFLRSEQIKILEKKSRNESLNNFDNESEFEKNYVKNGHKYSNVNRLNAITKNKFNSHITTPTKIDFGRHTKARAQIHSRKNHSSKKNKGKRSANKKRSDKSESLIRVENNDGISIILDKYRDGSIMIPVESYDVYNSFYLSSAINESNGTKLIISQHDTDHHGKQDSLFSISSQNLDKSKDLDNISNISSLQHNIQDDSNFTGFSTTQESTNGDQVFINTRSKYRDSPSNYQISHDNTSSWRISENNNIDYIEEPKPKKMSSFANFRKKIPFVSRSKSSKKK
ncbi:Myosin-2B [Smittium mucronatum]|uniref:Myosin-2B n=1 Tax=Smittium mucronatum TaxID=133383 RepID=A0A1R0GQM4_9FUNG|nr:Myosin-2B [Smittium mucronatum]